MNYYNEIDPYAAQWLRNLILAGLIPHGEVDERSIAYVSAADLAGFRQCHFFAGIGGWALAARLAGWPDDRQLWTGSPPCQPFSRAGKQRGADDARHLWPHLFRLISAVRPDVVMGEQVAAAVGKGWLDGVFDDLEGVNYACGAAVVPACAVNAPHRRDRLWFVAERSGVVGDTVGAGLERHAGHVDEARMRTVADRPAATTGVRGNVAHADRDGCEPWRATTEAARHWRTTGPAHRVGAWDGARWIVGHDGNARRVEPGIQLLANGIPARMGELRAFGNAIVPQVAAEVISAYLDRS